MPEPRVGVGLFVFRPDGTFIIGKRKGALGSGNHHQNAHHPRKESQPQPPPSHSLISLSRNNPNATPGTLGLPGGHLEFGETFASCAARELTEETGIAVKPERIHFLTAGNNVFEGEGRHYVTIAMGVLLTSAEVDLEPKVRILPPLPR
ncbi:hypothetical protein Vi05172_g11750 [Venturia inaequalis]|nr:hypothetical protein Vi05172_g11750 [Venturia inaequalis]